MDDTDDVNRRSTPSGVLAAVALGGMLAVQLSTTALWWTFGTGIPLLVLDVLLVGAFIAGPGMQPAGPPEGGSGEVEGMRLSTPAVLVIAAVAAAAAAFTAVSAGRDDPGCGSPLWPSNYDCVPIAGTGQAMLLAVVALAAAGIVAGATRRTGGFGVRVPPTGVLGGVAGVCFVGSAMVAPRTVPDMWSSGDGQRTVLEQVVGQTQLATALLTIGVTALAVAALATRAPERRLPSSTLVVTAAAAVTGGIAVAVAWIAVLADFLKGP